MSRVLFITSKPCHPWDGGGWRTRHILEALVALGYEVDLVTVPSGAPCRVKGVNVHLVPRLPFCRRLPEGVSLRRCVLDTLMLFKAVFLSGRSRYTIIHGVDDCGTVAWMTGALTRRPFLYDMRGGVGGGPVVWRRRWLRNLSAWLNRLALRRADVVLGENPDAVAVLSRWGRAARACVIPDLPALTMPVPVPMLNLARARFRGGGENRV
ncbi:MAG: glycosyltransferase, partial [Kiritimatiellaeota bacterium]|nr:glycosyltransferase [Kiritimatiellota bacterium]